jgi:hypothetical protein
VIAVEEPALLMAVQWVFRGIEIKNDLRRGASRNSSTNSLSMDAASWLIR